MGDLHVCALALAAVLGSAAAFGPPPAHGVGRWRGCGPAPCAQPQAAPQLAARRDVSMRARLTRQHDFGIDPKKVESLFDRIEALEIDLVKDVEEKFIRGSGAGGQKINKTSNNVQLVHLPTGVQVNSQRERMREKNRFLALRDLVDKLEVQKGGGAKTAAEKAADKKKKQKARRKRKSSKKQAAGDVVGEATASEETGESESEDE